MMHFFYVLYLGSLLHKRIRVKVKVPEYGSRFPSMGQGSRVRILDKIRENHKNFRSLKIILIFGILQKKIKMGNLPCRIGHRIPIWAQKD